MPGYSGSIRPDLFEDQNFFLLKVFVFLASSGQMEDEGVGPSQWALLW